jgi:hypothetical protein
MEAIRLYDASTVNPQLQVQTVLIVVLVKLSKIGEDEYGGFKRGNKRGNLVKA